MTDCELPSYEQVLDREVVIGHIYMDIYKYCLFLIHCI